MTVRSNNAFENGRVAGERQHAVQRGRWAVGEVT